MLFAILEIGDFAIIALLILVLAGGRAAASAFRRPSDRDRIKRIEDKLDLILTELNIDYVPPTKPDWQELADDPSQKIAAIRAYREQHGVGLADAKKAVEDYVEGKGR